MIFGAARVAPEKAVFRPALPMSFLPGTSEMQMATKLTYKEQLQHPNWQRRRLEMLSAAGFQCTACGDKEKMLHVHHKKYIKGRMAWEYSDTELEVLCIDCHQTEHTNRELLDRLLAVGANSLPLAIGLLAGYLEGVLDLDGEGDDYQAAMVVAEPWVRAGVLASILADGRPAMYLRATQASGARLTTAQRNALDEWAAHEEWAGERYPETNVFQDQSCDPLQAAAFYVPAQGFVDRECAATLIAGYCGHDMGRPYVSDPSIYIAGQVAHVLQERCVVSTLQGLPSALRQRNLETITAAVADFILDLQTRPDAPPFEKGTL